MKIDRNGPALTQAAWFFCCILFPLPLDPSRCCGEIRLSEEDYDARAKPLLPFQPPFQPLFGFTASRLRIHEALLNGHGEFPSAVGTALALVLMVGIPRRRRNWLTMLGLLMLFATIA